jgi:cysteine-rich repeat protein
MRLTTFQMFALLVVGCSSSGEKPADDDPGPGDPVAICGNNMVEMGEQCDDGNTTSGDGCSSACTTEKVGCMSAAPIMCGTPIMAKTDQPGSTTMLSTYNCVPDAMFTGNETIYEFTPTLPVLARLIVDAGASVAVVVEDDGMCPPAATCRSSTAGPITFAALAGRRYLIIVDAPAGTSETFFLNLTCQS